MIIDVTFEYNTKGHGSKTAYLNLLKSLSANKIQFLTNSLSKDIDLVHAEIPGPVSIIQSFIRKKPLVYSLHFHPKELAVVWGGGFMNWISKYYLRKAKVVIVPSKFSKLELEKMIKNKPISIISNGVDTKVFNKDKTKRKKFRDAYGIGKDDFVIYNVGSLNHKKGVDEFLRMARLFKDYKFLWAGRNFITFKEKFNPKTITSNYKNVILTGFVEDISTVHAAGDLLLYPSYFELQGIPVLEAMANKNPVIVRDIPVFDDWLIHGTNCLKAGSTSEFRKAISGIMDNKNLFRRLSSASYKTALKHELKVVGKKIKCVYELVLDNNLKPFYNDYSYDNNLR